MMRSQLRQEPALSPTQHYTLLAPSFIASTSQGYKTHASEPRVDERRLAIQMLCCLNIDVAAIHENEAL